MLVDGSQVHSKLLHWDHWTSWQDWYLYSTSFWNYRKDMDSEPIHCVKIISSEITWLRERFFQRNLHSEVSQYWPELLKSALVPLMRNASQEIEYSILSQIASPPSFLTPRKETPKPSISRLKIPWKKPYTKLDLIGIALPYILMAQ